MSLSNPPRLLVIILNYRTPRMTLRALEAALAALPQGGEVLPWEKIVEAHQQIDTNHTRGKIVVTIP